MDCDMDCNMVYDIEDNMAYDMENSMDCSCYDKVSDYKDIYHPHPQN